MDDASEMSAAPVTSTAASAETEPEIVAAIASGEGQPVVPAEASFHVTRSLGMALLGASLAAGFATACWARRRA